MMVTFISQCEKKALKRTRRILDSFANRIGDSVWQTAITEDGLDTVKKLLRKTATKSTAVSCHRIKSRQLTELVWIVGNKRKFNELGIVPVNHTKRNLMHQERENNWQNLTAISLIARLAALLHDIGKSNAAFQAKLNGTSQHKGEPYRHEWLSLKLFLWLITDCHTDEAVFTRLANITEYLSQAPQPNLDKHDDAPIDTLPPLTQWIAWLIVTHHRLPALADSYQSSTVHNMRKAGNRKYATTASAFYQQLHAIDYWMRNPLTSLSEKERVKYITQNWQFNELVLYSPTLQKQLKRLAQKAKTDPTLTALSQQHTDEKGTTRPITNPLLLNLSRLILMTGDHNYSALDKESKHRVAGDKNWTEKLIANTVRDGNNTPNQPLDEHLLGVANYCGQFAKALPAIQTALPKLKDHDTLAKNTDHPNFRWQNQAFKVARQASEISETHGFFAINMASTGCGKTIANARIAYALANPKHGARFTIALGLRTLTLQTGASLRQDIGLNDSQLAVLVGGSANKQLFDLEQEKHQLAQKDQDVLPHGSESAEDLISDYVDSDFDISDYDSMKFGVLTANSNTQKLLYSPVVSCTIDHLMQASEQQRGGHYIIPTLRLLSSDLILDEPDDFSDSDLPALTRLVHLAGLYGSRLILSSATLQPDQIHGLFTAYLEGRKLYNQHFNHPAPSIPCLWIDENHSSLNLCTTTEQCDIAHNDFLHKRQTYLAKQPMRRIGEILSITTEYDPTDDMADIEAELYQPLAAQLIEYAQTYHHRHHISYSEKTVSVGLIRMANITPLMHTALAMHTQTALPDDTHIHLAVYHSRQLLILRNQLETQLDRILNRKKDKQPTERHAIKTAIAAYPDAKHHLFIVLASPVCEVGRDHDYDWALVEPSSMRSLIQLAGRINRHRPNRIPSTPNIGIWQYNIRGLKQKQHTFLYPGYENQDYPLRTHDTAQLIPAEQLARIDAQPRIIKPNNLAPRERLADLEHQALAELMNNSDINIINAYWQDNTFNRQHTHLIHLSPFRRGEAETDYIIRPEDGKNVPYNLEQIKAHHGFHRAKPATDKIQPYIFESDNTTITPWLTASLEAQLNELADKLLISPNTAIMSFASITLSNRTDLWYFHEYFGCWEKA